MGEQRLCIAKPKRITHRLADCCDCDFYLDDYRDKNMTQKTRRHVEKTGHTVVYETGSSTRYEAF